MASTERYGLFYVSSNVKADGIVSVFENSMRTVLS